MSARRAAIGAWKSSMLERRGMDVAEQGQGSVIEKGGGGEGGAVLNCRAHDTQTLQACGG